MVKAWDWPVPFTSFTSVFLLYTAFYCVSVFRHTPGSSERCVYIRINACGKCHPLASLFKTWQWAGNLYFDSV